MTVVVGERPYLSFRRVMGLYIRMGEGDGYRSWIGHSWPEQRFTDKDNDARELLHRSNYTRRDEQWAWTVLCRVWFQG